MMETKQQDVAIASDDRDFRYTVGGLVVIWVIFVIGMLFFPFPL